MFDNEITITADHRYYENKKELIPVTSVVEAYKSDKDFNELAYRKAYWEVYRELKLAKGSAVPRALVADRHKKILEAWAQKAAFGAAHGDRIHGILHRFNTGVGITDHERHVIKAVTDTGLFRFSERSFHEVMIGSGLIGIAGTIDRLDVRSVKDRLVDIADYKTNLTGLSLDSVRVKPDGKVNKMNIYMKDPIAFMEECDYNLYCIQLGIYAYLLEAAYNMKIGRLCILYISVPQDANTLEAYMQTRVTVYPVPYLRPVIEAIIGDSTWRLAYEGIRLKKKEKEKNSAGALKQLPLIAPVDAPEAEVVQKEEEVW